MHLRVCTPGPGSRAARQAVPMAPWLQGLQAVEGLSFAPWFLQGAPEPGPGDITQPSGETDKGHARLDHSPCKRLASPRLHQRLAELFPPTKDASEGIRVARLELGVCQLCLLMVLCACVCICGGVRSKGVPGVGGCRGHPRSAWLKVCICVAPGLSLRVSDVLLCDWRMSGPTRVC